MTYQETAPVVSATGITKTQVETYFSNVVETTTPQDLPNITKTKVQAIADKMFSGEDFSPIQLASDVKLAVSQVKTIMKEITSLHGEYLTANPVDVTE